MENLGKIRAKNRFDKITPKYRGKILTDEVAFVTEAIRKTGAEMEIKMIDITVNLDRVHIFFQYPSKHSVSFIAKKIKGRSSSILRQKFPHLKEWCEDHLLAVITVQLGSRGKVYFDIKLRDQGY